MSRLKPHQVLELLENERALTRTLRGYVSERDKVIHALEAERDQALERVQELEAALGAALVHPPSVVDERNTYFEAIARIAQVVHQVEGLCSFAHLNATTHEGE